MIMNASNEEARGEKVTKHMMWGLIGLFIMFSEYTEYLNLLVNTLTAGS
jgi:hypothetical protein